MICLVQTLSSLPWTTSDSFACSRSSACLRVCSLCFCLTALLALCLFFSTFPSLTLTLVPATRFASSPSPSPIFSFVFTQLSSHSPPLFCGLCWSITLQFAFAAHKSKEVKEMEGKGRKRKERKEGERSRKVKRQRQRQTDRHTHTHTHTRTHTHTCLIKDAGGYMSEQLQPWLVSSSGGGKGSGGSKGRPTSDASELCGVEADTKRSESTCGEVVFCRNRQIDRQTDRQTHRQTDRQTDRHTHTHTQSQR